MARLIKREKYIVHPLLLSIHYYYSHLRLTSIVFQLFSTIFYSHWNGNFVVVIFTHKNYCTGMIWLPIQLLRFVYKIYVCVCVFFLQQINCSVYTIVRKKNRYYGVAAIQRSTLNHTKQQISIKDIWKRTKKKI